MKNNNAGFSLLEVVIVVAMITILAGSGMYGIGQLTGFRARETADEITSSLTQNKIETLGKAKSSGSMAWELYKDGKYLYVRTVYDAGTGSEYYSNLTEVSKNDLEVYVGTRSHGAGGGSSTNLSQLTDGDSYRVYTGINQWDEEWENGYFNRSTGALCNSDGSVMNRNPVIQVRYGLKEYEVEVISKTGKVISNSRR